MLHFLHPMNATGAGTNRQKGMTLIEIMIVLAIITAVLAIGGPRIFSSAASKRAAVRKLAVLSREIRNVARLYNETNRLVIKMDDEKGHTYSVESAPGNAIMLNEDQMKDIERMTEMQRKDAGIAEQFKPSSRVLKGEVALPKGLFFADVEYGNKKELVEKGRTYVHFFPHGLSEEVAIHVTDRRTLNWTITVHPLTGRADVYERRASLKELRP